MTPVFAAGDGVMRHGLVQRTALDVVSDAANRSHCTAESG